MFLTREKYYYILTFFPVLDFVDAINILSENLSYELNNIKTIDFFPTIVILNATYRSDTTPPLSPNNHA